MPDRNLFDDDSLTPDWMRNAGLGGWEEQPSAGEPEDTALPAAERAPWDVLRGDAPPGPAKLLPAAPPWEQFAGEEPPPPSRPTVEAPWEILGSAAEETEDAGDEFTWAAQSPDQGGPDSQFDSAFDWSGSAPPSESTGERTPRSGLTSMLGELPWAGDKPSQSQPEQWEADAWDTDQVDPWETERTEPIERPSDRLTPLASLLDELDAESFFEPPAPKQPPVMDYAGPDDQPVTMSDLLDEFQQETPAAPPPPPQKPASLADRLRAMSPKAEPPAPPAPSQPAPRPVNAQEADWMSAFGQAAEFPAATSASDEADLDWLMPPESGGEVAEQPPTPRQPEAERPPSIEAEFDSLFEDEFAAGSGQPRAEEEFEEEELPWLADEDLSANQEPPISEDLAPNWLRQQAEPPAAPKPPSSGIRRLGQSTPPAAPESAPAPKPPSGGIRRLGQSTPPPAEPEPAPEKQAMTYEEWEQLQIDREQEASKTPEDRLLEEVPDWFKDMGGNPPATPQSAQPAQPESQGPEFMPGWFMGLEEQSSEEAPDWLQKIDYSSDLLAQPFAEQEPAAPPPPDESEIPDWFKGAAAPEIEGLDWDSMFAAPAEPAEPPPAQPPAPPSRLPEPAALAWIESELAPADEAFPLPDMDLLGGLEEAGIAPGEVPSWLSDAAPGRDEIAAPEEMSFPDSGEAFPLPDMDLLGGLEEAEMAPGEVPSWLADAAPGRDEIATPEEVPFPDLDLDQTMPGELAVSGLRVREYDKVLDDEFPLPPSEPDDFVERFDPLEPEHFTPSEPERSPKTRKELDADAPNWLRELAAEQPLPTDLLPDQFADDSAWADEALPTEEQPDWLGGISAEDISPESDWPTSERSDRPVADMPPRPEPGFKPAPGLIETGDMDSAALDRLLGMYDPDQPAPGTQADQLADLDSLWADTSPGQAEPFSASPAFDQTGEPDAGWMPDEQAPGLESLFAEAGSGEAIPDLESLFDESGFEGTFEPFAEEAPPAPVEEPQPDLRFRPAPDVPAKFKPAEPAPSAERAQPAGAEAHPEWISEMRPSDLPVVVRAGGAETSVKQKQVVELPERLRAFREATLRDLPQPGEALAPDQSGPLAGITGALPAAGVLMPKTTVKPVEGLVITKDQQARLNKLQALLDQVAAEEGEAEQDRAGYDEAALMALGEEAPADAPVSAGPVRRARRQRRFKLDRLLVAVLLLVALVIPFATDALHFGNNPPALSGAGQHVAGAVDTVSAGRYVLFAFEYGPTAAGELDPLAEAVLRDVLARKAIPLILSTNPAGAFHAEAVLKPLGTDPKLLAARGQGETTLTAGKDYFILSYLPGEAVGVRSLRHTSTDDNGSPQTLYGFKTDVRGDETHLNVTSLERDIALVVVVGEDSNAVRMWAEQLSGAKVPKVALVTAALEPLAVPYVNQGGYVGVLAGVRDAYSYDAARNANSRQPYAMPKDLPVKLPNPEESRWHSMALGGAAAAGLIALGMVLNLFRALVRRRR